MTDDVCPNCKHPVAVFGADCDEEPPCDCRCSFYMVDSKVEYL